MMGYAQNYGGQQAQAQQQWQQPAQQQQQQAWAQPQQQAAAQPSNSPAGTPTIGSANQCTVSGCTHATVGPIVRGSFSVSTENHGRRAYKRDSQVNGLDVQIYFWDERDGPGFCGWWFGPKIGGDQVWAYHPDKTAMTPPLNGWKVPYDGPVDPTLLLSIGGAGAGGAVKPLVSLQAQPMQQAQAQQQQWAQQQQQGGAAQWQQAQQQLQLQRQQGVQGVAQPGVLRLNQPPPQQAEQMRQKMIEEQRKKLEEANQARVAAQAARMEEVKQQQLMLQQKRAEEAMKRAELLKKQQDEMEKKRAEQLAVMSLRRAVAKLRAATLMTIPDLKKELEETMGNELEKCDSQREAIEKECKAALDSADAKLRAVEEQKRKLEEAKLAEERKKQEQAELCAKRIGELQDLIQTAENSIAELQGRCDALAAGSGTPTEIEVAFEQTEQASTDAKAKAKACSEFIAKHSTDMRPAPLPKGDRVDPDQPTLAKLVVKTNELTRTIETTFKKAGEAKVTSLKKAVAGTKVSQSKKALQKYDKDQDGFLNRKELMAYAKAEFKFVLPAADADELVEELSGQDGKGVPLNAYSRVRIALGISKEKARDLQRREERLAREKIIAERKVQLTALIEAAGQIVTDGEDAIKAAHDVTNPLPVKAKAASSKEMLAMANEAEGVYEAAKSKVEQAKTAVKGLSSEADPELAAFVKVGAGKLVGRMASFDGRLTKINQVVNQCRENVAKKLTQEHEALRAQALTLVRYHQGETQLKCDDLYKQFDKRNRGQVDESNFLAFFKMCKKPDDYEDNKLSTEDLSRLFSYLDEDNEHIIKKEAFMSFIRYHMRVVKETVCTDSLDIKTSKNLRRLELDEVCEVLEGPIKEENVGILRVRVRLLADDIEGWVTPIGNQGTTFLQEGDLKMKVLKETILTPTFEIGASSKTIRKLKEGETVEVREWMRKEEASGLSRMKVKTADGKIGWATAVGSSGAVFLQAC